LPSSSSARNAGFGRSVPDRRAWVYRTAFRKKRDASRELQQLVTVAAACAGAPIPSEHIETHPATLRKQIVISIDGPAGQAGAVLIVRCSWAGWRRWAAAGDVQGDQYWAQV